jgi:hypothetical protein
MSPDWILLSNCNQSSLQFRDVRDNTGRESVCACVRAPQPTMVPDQLNQNRFVLIGEELPVQQSQNKKHFNSSTLGENL